MQAGEGTSSAAPNMVSWGDAELDVDAELELFSRQVLTPVRARFERQNSNIRGRPKNLKIRRPLLVRGHQAEEI